MNGRQKLSVCVAMVDRVDVIIDGRLAGGSTKTLIVKTVGGCERGMAR